MLYATTRSKSETYTAYRALHEDLAPDGGAFVPFKMPKFTLQQLDQMSGQSFGETMAQILNIFFSARLTGWDIDCCIGKSAVKISAMSRRVILAELWNNPHGDFAYTIDILYQKLCGDTPEGKPTQWAKIAIYIAVLFAALLPLRNQGMRTVDICVNSGDFLVPMAAWYARNMGLPLGTIICSCNENSTAWDFLHRGELNTGAATVHTTMKALDVSHPAGLERLIFATLGFDENRKYLETAARRGVYQIRPDMVEQVSAGMFVSVVGKDRVVPLISSVYRSNDFVLDPYTAISYGGLQDYRAKTGESHPTVLLWQHSPMRFLDMVQNATGLAELDIEEKLNRN